MIAGWWAFFLGSPLKLFLWLGNRLVTWTGMALLWRQFRHVPDGIRRFIVWCVAINAVSILLLIEAIRLLARRP